MAQYSIKELEQLSGIKAHTIRVWEQRYEILSPKRTETNIRYYDDADLRTILNISLLNEHGYKISRIAKMSCQEMGNEVMQVVKKNAPYSQQVQGLLLTMIEMDEARFDKLLTTAILQRGLEKTMLEVICPFLTQTGILWQTGNITPAQEHFVSNIIRQKLYVAIDGQITVDPKTANRFLLYLPEGELHEIGLLFSSYLLRSRAHHVLYLGQNLPFVDLKTCVHYYKPHYICTAFTAFTAMPDYEQVQVYINQLAELAEEIIVFVSGNLAQDEILIFPSNITKITTLPLFIEHINKLTHPVNS